MTPRDKKAKEQEKAAQEAGDEAAQAVKDRTGVGDKPPSDPDELREEIQETREELGATVEALSDKADVKGQATQKVAEGKEQLKEKQEQAKAKVSELGDKVGGATPEDVKGAATQAMHTAEERPFPAIAAAFGAGVVVGWIIKRR
jgi:ElaB/YqjD/DUF883 family membrane-anchored ribosome-binding protein